MMARILSPTYPPSPPFSSLKSSSNDKQDSDKLGVGESSKM